ncbi:hypothetical protein QQ045_028548 [Rhodiola kirilowii]
MSLSLASPTFSTTWKFHKIKPVAVSLPALFQKRTRLVRKDFSARAFLFNPAEDPLVKEALKEPVAFMGGMFAGLLRLDLNEDPLREWVTRTVEASGLTAEEMGTDESPADDEAPQQIEID